LSTSLTALTSVDGILSAVGDRIHVASSAADGVAGRAGKGGANQYNRENLLNHDVLLV
jgi:hypothetical protein